MYVVHFGIGYCIALKPQSASRTRPHSCLILSSVVSTVRSQTENIRKELIVK